MWGPEKWRERAVRAAESALADHNYVSPLDLVVGMGLLAGVNVGRWRQGRIEALEPLIQGSPEKLRQSFEFFRKWADARGLRPSEAPYVRNSRDGMVNLRGTTQALPEVERFFRTHWVPQPLQDSARKKVEERLAAAPKLSVSR